MKPFATKRSCTCWLFAALLCVLGCGQSKESLHEMDHVTPAHWPADLQDAATKIRERLMPLQAQTQVDGDMTAFEELGDLVGWVPEIAADTDLPEAEWNKLYEASEVARKELLGTKTVSTELAKKIETLCELLSAAQQLLPQPDEETILDASHASNLEASL